MAFGNECAATDASRSCRTVQDAAEWRARAMNIIILDDYQDAVRKLKCAAKLEPLNAKVFTNTVKGIGQDIEKGGEAIQKAVK